MKFLLVFEMHYLVSASFPAVNSDFKYLYVTVEEHSIMSSLLKEFLLKCSMFSKKRYE